MSAQASCHSHTHLLERIRTAFAAVALCVVSASTASAYVGESFLEVPGIAGGWQGEKYKDWLRIDANYWKVADVPVLGGGARRRGLGAAMHFSGPLAPREGASAMVISIGKSHPSLSSLMDMCVKKTKLPELTYAESSERSRPPLEYGPRPAEIPEYFEYKLKDVQLTDCPVVSDAPDQAFVVSFGDIAWLNYHGEPTGIDTSLKPAVLPPGDSSGATKSFVVTWFAVAHDIADDQCPVVNEKPNEDDYFALMSKEAADKERAELASRKTGVDNQNEQMAHRGPNKLNACKLPGITKNPGHAAPQTTLARGLDLDGDDGTGPPPAGVCKHKNYSSVDGRSGIDNQLFTVQGCIPGYMGHKGFLMQYNNEQRRNGSQSALFMISGIDNEQNDDSVDVTVLYSNDPMVKDATGTRILADYTFRVSNSPVFTPYFTRLKGKIVNGAVVTERVKKLTLRIGGDDLYDAGMRLELMPDGSMKGVVGGYQDWRAAMTINGASLTEGIYGYKCPAINIAYKRAADGLKDPVTGECNGISTAYDVEGVPAFIPPAQRKALMTATETNGRKQ